MKPIIRAALALIIGLTLLPLLALAQPAPAASAPAALTAADITYDGACGAPGVGRQWSAAHGRARDEIHARDGKPGVRVGPHPGGYWSACKMPPPKDCAARRAPGWVVDGYLCQPVRDRMIPARNAPFSHDVGAAKDLRNTGIQHWRCERAPDGQAAWVAKRATCKPRPRSAAR